MFLVHSIEGGNLQPWELVPASAITPKVGLALALSSGQLVVATGTTKPEYICMSEKAAAVSAGTLIPVIRANEEIIFQTTNQASFADIAIGNKVTLHSDGLQVTATTASGVAEVVGIGGTAAGSEILVRF